MCGHVGIAGKLEHKDEATIRRLLILDYFRGPDSTGIAAVNESGTDAKIAKVASHPLDLFDMTKFKNLVNGFNSSVFLGHNRAATRGVVNGNNAHPYEFGHIIGAHNGTLSASTFSRLKMKLGEDYDVDSQAIFACIEKFGVQETVQLFQRSEDNLKCDDAWALVWYDLSDRSINFLRNKERPFWYASTIEGDRIIWASEWPMIDAAVKMSNAPYELYTCPDKGYRFWQIATDTHFKFKIEDLKKGCKGRPEPVLKTVEGKASPPVVYATAGHSPFPSHNSVSGNVSGGTSTSTTNSRSTLLGNASRQDNVIHLFGTETAPFAGLIDRDYFDKIAEYGCSWCGADIEFSDLGVSIFERDDTILCPSCGVAHKNHTRVYTKDIEAARLAAGG